jgi:leucyl/phenylalanyl-tRNA--protein transferase
MATGLTPDLLLRAYAAGIFPMAESADDPELYWVDPVQRGILPLDKFHLPKRLARTVRSERFSVVCDRDFAGVMRGCAEATTERPQTWINDEILAVYVALYKSGHAHSVEAYSEGALVGGLYGVSLGGAFFGESMFSRVTDASKVALVHLTAHLLRGGYRLLDTQFVTDHLSHFGTIEISRARYRRLLAVALKTDAYFPEGGLTGVDAVSVLQSSTLIS